MKWTHSLTISKFFSNPVHRDRQFKNQGHINIKIMAQQVTKRCVCCNAEFGSGQKTKSIALTPRGMNVTYYEIISTVLNETAHEGKALKVLTPAKEKYYENRIVCETCGVSFKNAYVSILKIRELLSSESYVAKHLIARPCEVAQSEEKQETGAKELNIVDVAIQTDAVIVASTSISSNRPHPKTPIKRKILKAYTIQVQRGRMHNAFKYIVKDEMETFSAFSTICSLCPDSFKLVSDDEIEDQMRELCPTVLKTFYGMFLQAPSDEHFIPEMRTGIAVASFARNRSCNGFQKTVGLLLYKDGASRKVVPLSINTL
jgi:hypothetical protein